MLSETDLTGLILIRRHLHQYPELSRAEVLTADYISARLTDLGLHPERDGAPLRRHRPARVGRVGQLMSP